jgi:site-specific DNA-adenine methylase
MKIRKPRVSGLIRYPGGKGKLLAEILSRLQRMFALLGPEAEFREPFLGGGAVGLSLLAGNPGIRRAWLNGVVPGLRSRLEDDPPLRQFLA